MFPLPTWNYRDVTLAGGSRTNNICEGWNNAFARLVGNQHPSLHKLICDENMVGMNIVQSQNGITHIRQRRQQYVRLQTHLQNPVPCRGGVKWVKFTRARTYKGPVLIRHIHFVVRRILDQ